MQSPASSGAGGAAPPIALSPVERSAFAHLFNLADPERTGIVTGDAAVSFFAKSKLPPAILGQIWAMADSANNGFLTPPSFSIALRLIAHAQRGETITEASIKRPGPPPTMEGVNLPLTAQLTGSQSAAAVLTNMPGVIEIKPEDRARYTRIFANSGPVGGLIDGDRAKEIFVKSKLPFDKLGAIWNLADTQARGSLDLTDFIIAMHFIQNTMNGTLNSIPAALPPGLYEQAKGSGGVGSRVIPGSPLAAQNTGGSASGFGSSGVPRQMTGSFFPAQSAFQSPRQPAAAPAAPWDVTPDEKARADQFFDGLDASKQGRLDGATVVPFFMQSKLSESVLAHVWDLSDVTQSGTLSKDEFAVAMHLINGQLAGKPLPQELPSSLVPPSMRNMDLPTAVNPQQTDTQKDLFSLMDDDPPAPAISASSAFITPSAAAPVVAAQQSTPFAASSPAPAQRSAPGPFDDDFFGGANSSADTPAAAQPTQPFAAALSPAPTGGSFGSAAAFRSPGVASPGGPASPAASTSRLGTAFATAVPASAAGAAAGAAFASGGGSDQSAEYGNKANQLQSNEKAVSDLQSQRGTLESSIATNTSSIAELESRLATVRGQHETETKLVKDLEERHQKQSVELKELRETVIREESELSALKAEKDELEQALMRDREDVRDMKKRMNDVQTETKSLKEQLEKLRKDARQQKGLVAISKKQLTTAEAEQDKVAGEIESVQRGDLGADDEAGQHQASPAVPAAVAPSTRSAAVEPVTSPAASVRSYNPFDRFGAGTGTASSQPGTPGATHQPSTATSLLAGAGAGAALGGVAAAAAHHEHDSQDATQISHAGDDASGQQQSHQADPFGVQHTEGQPTSPIGFDDAFAVPGESGIPTSSATAGHAQAASADFDDNFGDDFGATASAVPASTATESAAPGTTADENVTGQLHAAELGAAGGLGAGAGVLGASAVHAAEPTHETEAAKGFESSTDTAGPFGGGDSTADTNRPDALDADEDEDSSDDEDDGPEEVGGYKARGYDTPVGGAANRFPEVDNTADGAPASTAALAQDDGEHTVPGGLGDVTAAAAPASAAPVDPTSIGQIGERTASTTSIAPISRQETVSEELSGPLTTSEASQTKDTEGSHLAAGTAAAGGIGVAALAAGAGALTLGERGHGDTTPSVASPTDDNVPLSQLLESKGSKPAPPTAAADVTATAPTDPSASPTLSTKTRRAPPPAPVRSTTNLSTSSGAPAVAPTVLAAEPTAATGAAAPVTAVGDSNKSTNPFGMDDFGAGGVQHKTAANDSGSNFDDFDSAFEDLGPSEAVPSSTGAGATGAGGASASTGFDDAFDNDFDFVPSFSGAGGAVPAAAPVGTAGGEAATRGGNNAFDDFDAAFDSAPSGASAAKDTSSVPAAAGAIPALGAVAGSGSHADRGTASNATSGFSFEDAFDPTPTGGASNTAAPASINTASAASTSTPTGGVTSPSSVSSPVVPTGTYAPPPGPPPGFNAPPTLPSRSSTRTTGAAGGTAIAEAEDYTGALPDDAAPVKQLCGMGFTREKVIQALEKSNYRTEKALERLLASA
ncbi:EH domain-containing and endocytosis protein 1 [Pseudozyma hubeiensis]|nr:EH domain-containing and endocytosis protein 1 [Pseudozyma hubeiensis]